MLARRKTIYFHIGLERTGTTSLQRHCARHARHLLQDGFLYPTRSAAFAHVNHAPLAASYLPAGRPIDHHLRGDDTRHVDIIKTLKAEIDASAAPTVLISSEHLSSRFRAPQVEALARDFTSYDCKILVSLREHFALLTSSYATHVRSGSTQTFEDYAAMVCAPGNVYLRYADLLGLWATAFGRDRVEIVSYAKDRDSVGDVLARVGLRGPLARGQPSCNQSLDRASTEALRMVNVVLNAQRDASTADSYLEFRRQDYIRSRLSGCLRRAAAPADWVVPNAHRSMLIELVEADRRALAETYDVDLESIDLAGLPGGDLERSSAEHLASAFIQAVFEQPSQRALLASRGATYALIDGVRRLKARQGPRAAVPEAQRQAKV